MNYGQTNTEASNLNQLCPLTPPKLNQTATFNWFQEHEESCTMVHLCDHIHASFLSQDHTMHVENECIENPYSAVEYSHYLDSLLKEIRLKNLDRAKAIFKQHQIRTKSLGGGPSIKWDIVNDITRNCSPFLLSIFVGCERTYLWLLNEGGDVTQNTHDGFSPLILAVQANHASMVNLLIAQPRLDVNWVSRLGSALHLASKHDQIDIVRMLLTHPKINLQILDNTKQSPLDIATFRCKQLILSEIHLKSQEKAERLAQTFRSSIRMSSTQQNSFIANRPKKPPIFKGYVLKLHRLKIFMYLRYLVLDPESGVLARFTNAQQFPLNPIELIALEDIESIEVCVDRWFQKSQFSYLQIGYANDKSLFLAFESKMVCQKWMEAIKTCVGYTRYLKLKLEKYVLSKEQKKAFKRVVELLMENVNQEVEIGESIYQGSEIKKSESASRSKHLQLQIGIRDLELLGLVGQGAFGHVYKVKLTQNGQIYALKQQEKLKLQRAGSLGYALNEIRLLKKLYHPFLVNIQCAFQTEKNLYFLQDYFENGDLTQYMTGGVILDLLTAQFITAQLILVIEYLHSEKIIYRDLKPENILLDDKGYIKLIDFGLSKEVVSDERPALSFCGSPAYLSPEIVRGKGTTKASDVYGIGLLLYEMLTGFPPHYAVAISDLLNRIKYNSISFEHLQDKQAVHLLEKMLNQKPELRPTIQAIKEDLFFADIDWGKLYEKQLIPPQMEIKHNRKSSRAQKKYQLEEALINDIDYESLEHRSNYIEDWDFQ